MTRPIVQKIQAIQVDPAELLHLNNLKSQLKVLEPGREVLVPTKFSCLGQFFQAAFNYTFQENSTIDLSDIACIIFEGLAKPGTLFKENTSEENNVEMGTKLRVPLKCACPDNFSNGSGVKYLVTYPLVEGDEPSILSEIFSISPVDLWVANNFQPWPTIYPNTTVLVPLKIDPVINFSIHALHLQWLHGLLVGSNGRSSPLSFPTPSSPRSGKLAENDYSWSDLVFELPGNGCLRGLLSNSSNPLRWDKRTEIAFDIATDIFAFGVALLELISGKDDVDGKSFKECIAFLGGKTTEGGCFDGLRSLKEDYPLPDALCLAVLAKACAEVDPLHRPSMDDILKVLVRMVR
ncbi:LYSM-DOMAIN RECEPTOR-LIKE KINASE [Salix viminalis]|uniref:LYSM-DOMAIN RECEPTOR-LIKE KINASE n=1 Tax=Salix viminalis TaxID=40686 RepID=A0A9Q0NIU2_SALVM|nr:LYSM-DOMAIN RECEPTOR-LIKE KINASE [Salix viminalis]